MVDRSAIDAVRPLTTAHEPVPSAVEREREGFRRRYGRHSGGRDLADVRHGYFASVAFLDRQVGRILAELERRGLSDNTLVLFVSDHGDMIGDYELITKGAYFYDPCTRVPMILRLPEGERAGARVSELVQPHDLAATLLHAAGLPAAETAALMPESQDLAALARGEVAAPRDYALTMYRNSGYGNRGYWDPPIYGTMFHDGRYKLALFHDPEARREPEGELYDMAADPTETRPWWPARCGTWPAAAAPAGQPGGAWPAAGATAPSDRTSSEEPAFATSLPSAGQVSPCAPALAAARRRRGGRRGAPPHAVPPRDRDRRRRHRARRPSPRRCRPPGPSSSRWW